MGYDRYITEDPALGLPEAEKALKALIGVLKTCLILSRERAEKLCMDLDSYRGSRSDSAEDESFAQTAFEDDVDHAEEILAWRAVVVAELVGEALSGYAKSHSPLDDRGWRGEPHQLRNQMPAWYMA